MSGLNLKEEGIMMRRLTMSILTVIIVAVMSVPLFAFGSTKVGTLSMEQADGSASGGLVTIQLSVESNPGLNRLAVQLIYDSNAMTFAGVSNSGVFSSCDSTPSTGVVNLSFSTGFDTTQSGKIADIVFFVTNPLAQNSQITAIPQEAYNSSGVAVTVYGSSLTGINLSEEENINVNEGNSDGDSDSEDIVLDDGDAGDIVLDEDEDEEIVVEDEEDATTVTTTEATTTRATTTTKTTTTKATTTTAEPTTATTTPATTTATTQVTTPAVTTTPETTAMPQTTETSASVTAGSEDSSAASTDSSPKATGGTVAAAIIILVLTVAVAVGIELIRRKGGIEYIKKFLK